MNKVSLAIMLLASLLITDAKTCSDEVKKGDRHGRGIRMISARLAYLKHSQGAILVDSMNPKTFAKYHILGAINLPTDSEANRKRWSNNIRFPKNLEIVIYCDCAGEGTAIGAAKILKGKGYQNVMVVKGGFDALTKIFPVIWEGNIHFPGDRKGR